VVGGRAADSAFATALAASALAASALAAAENHRAEEVGSIGDEGVDDDVVTAAGLLVEVVEEGVELGKVAGGVEAEADHDGKEDGVAPGEQRAAMFGDRVESAVFEGTGFRRDAAAAACPWIARRTRGRHGGTPKA